MPVWYEAARRWVAEGKLVLLGITQEQHAERCRLFAQWKQLDFPILHDPINLLGPKAVPLFVAIDEHGIVRATRARPERLEAEFLGRSFPAPQVGDAGHVDPITDLQQLRRRARQSPRDAGAQLALGDGLVLWGGEARLDEAISAYRKAVEQDGQNAAAHFRLGVAYRLRYDSARRHAGDFQQAVEHWTRALDLDPNHYIRRRRIQQYGPRLIKPYPFYDWVDQARREIIARGEKPIRLRVALSGAEIAQPARRFAPTAQSGEQNPDAQGRIARDKQGWIQAETAIVPAHIRAGEAARIHIVLWPRSEAHWNNEAEPTRLWIDPPDGWTVERRLLEAPALPEPETREPRRLELEIRSPARAAGAVTIPMFALYYVCEDQQGTCQFLRQDIPVIVQVQDKP